MPSAEPFRLDVAIVVSRYLHPERRRLHVRQRGARSARQVLVLPVGMSVRSSAVVNVTCAAGVTP